MSYVMISAIVVTAIALFIGIFLGVASETFKVEVDPIEEKIRSYLPGNNCGGCGYPGCDGLAHAITIKEAPVDACPVGGNPVASQIAAAMGSEVEEKEKEVAFVKCDGGCLTSKPLYHYSGIKSCATAKVIGSSSKACQHGCIGYGDCVNACPFDAIHIVKGVALVDEEKCKACSKCVVACPNNLIELVPYSANQRVMCNSKDKGIDARKQCDVSCIGCGVCKKQCPFDAITLEDNLAKIDYSKCKHCGKCAVVCPRKCIHIYKH